MNDDLSPEERATIERARKLVREHLRLEESHIHTLFPPDGSPPALFISNAGMLALMRRTEREKDPRLSAVAAEVTPTRLFSLICPQCQYKETEIQGESFSRHEVAQTFVYECRQCACNFLAVIPEYS